LSKPLLVDSAAFAYVPNIRKQALTRSDLSHLGSFSGLAYGISIYHVPCKGTAQCMADLVGGQVDLAISTSGPAVLQLQTGRIRALGVSRSKRVCFTSPPFELSLRMLFQVSTTPLLVFLPTGTRRHSSLPLIPNLSEYGYSSF
jgi:hypothetical protein